MEAGVIELSSSPWAAPTGQNDELQEEEEEEEDLHLHLVI